MKKKKINKLTILEIIVCVLIIVCIINIVTWNMNNIENENIIEDILNSDIVKRKVTLIGDKQIDTLEINYNELDKISSDIKGWIQVNNTNINYPFVQSTDNSFYLTHNLKGEYNSAGWIFVDYNNNLEDLDKNTIIYGHNRLNDSMFAELEKTLNKDWYENEENRYIIFSTKHNDYIGEIISIYEIKASDFSASYNYTDEEFLNYISDIKSKSIYDFETEVDVSDKIVTLYTCDKTSENRIILQAKLIEY